MIHKDEPQACKVQVLRLEERKSNHPLTLEENFIIAKIHQGQKSQ